MNICPFCKTEAGGIGSGDEFLDYCHECSRIVEGETIDDMELEQQFQQWWQSIDADAEYIRSENAR